MYWTETRYSYRYDRSTSWIRRANLDGSEVEDLVTSGLTALFNRYSPGCGRGQDVLDRHSHGMNGSSAQTSTAR